MTRHLLSAALLVGLGGGVALAETDKGYSLQAAPARAQVGQAATAAVELKPSAGMHVNLEYPTSMTVAYPAGVAGAAAKVKPSKIDKTVAHFDVAFTPSEKGKKVLSGTVSFVVCNDANTQCDPRREQVQITVDVR